MDLAIICEQELTPSEFSGLGDVPPGIEWLANITNLKTGRAHRIDVTEFAALTGLQEPPPPRTVTRAHVIAWREHLESRERAPFSIRASCRLYGHQRRGYRRLRAFDERDSGYKRAFKRGGHR